jgi:FixJ family two-component response regulator
MAHPHIKSAGRGAQAITARMVFLTYTERMSRIFIIDDDSLVILSLRACLTKAGYEVDAYNAIEQIPTPWPVGRWDCVICDFFIFDRTGSEVLELVRAAGDQVPFIYLTANDDLRTAIEGIKKGANDYILKPFDAAAMLHCVERNIKAANDCRILRELQKDREAFEAEKRQIINWRLMYAAKENRQTEIMIRQLSRSINKSGGYGWVDLIRADMVKTGDGRVSLSSDIIDLVLDITNEQKRILDYLNFMAMIDKTEMDMKPMKVSELMASLEEILGGGIGELATRNQRSLKLSRPRVIRDGLVKIDKSYLEPILRELVVNAIKYSPKGGDITVYPQWERVNNQDQLEIVVANEAVSTSLSNEHGVVEQLLGIPYEYCELVFDMFYSIDPAGHTIEGEEWRDGSGLFIVRKLMKRMGGWVKACNAKDLSADKPRVVVNVTLEFPLDV